LSLPDNCPLDRPFIRSPIKPEWLELIRDFPDRFVIGSDQFNASPKSERSRPHRSMGPRMFMDQLPEGLARKVGIENAARIYNLGTVPEH
jgi:hypothetical protein